MGKLSKLGVSKKANPESFYNAEGVQEEQARKQQEQVRREQEEKAKRDQEEQARRDQEEKARREQEEQAKREQEEKARKEQEHKKRGDTQGGGAGGDPGEGEDKGNKPNAKPKDDVLNSLEQCFKQKKVEDSSSFVVDEIELYRNLYSDQCFEQEKVEESCSFVVDEIELYRNLYSDQCFEQEKVEETPSFLVKKIELYRKVLYGQDSEFLPEHPREQLVFKLVSNEAFLDNAAGCEGEINKSIMDLWGAFASKIKGELTRLESNFAEFNDDEFITIFNNLDKPKDIKVMVNELSYFKELGESAIYLINSCKYLLSVCMEIIDLEETIEDCLRDKCGLFLGECDSSNNELLNYIAELNLSFNNK
jgi:chemotaxis protein histidine kinase CheA